MWYIGRRILRSKNDGYIGSGKRFKYAKKKYGKYNFKREILFAFDNKQDMIDKEVELVNEDVVNDEMSYNMEKGGKGAKPGKENHRWGIKHTEKTKRKIGLAQKGRKHSKQTKQKQSKMKQGEKSSTSKLTEKDVIEIRNNHQLWQWGGVTQIAKKYNITKATISDIKHNKTWKHI